jgi:hypothetical protein
MDKIDFNIIYTKIVEALKANNYTKEIVGIESSSAGVVTGGEALMNQAGYLVSLKHSNPSAFRLVQDEVREFLKYCRQQGLIIEQ